MPLIGTTRVDGTTAKTDRLGFSDDISQTEIYWDTSKQAVVEPWSRVTLTA